MGHGPAIIVIDRNYQVKWDTGLSVSEYAARMSDESQWGGGIEMAVVSYMKQAQKRV